MNAVQKRFSSYSVNRGHKDSLIYN